MVVPTSRSLSKSKPKLIGLTGGIGAGKSVAAKIFATLGIPIFDSDRAGKDLLEKDTEVRRKVVDIFGDKAYVKGTPDRKYLAGIVFSDPDMREKLNAIIHPSVRRAFRDFADEHASAPYVINEAAILIETGAYEQLDALILVTAPEDVRIERVTKRDGVTAEEVRKRMGAQWPEEKKRGYAQYVIENDGVQALIPAVLKIHRALLGSEGPQKS